MNKKPTQSAIRAMIAAQAPDQTPEGRDKLAIKLGFMAKRDSDKAYIKAKKPKKVMERPEEGLQLTLASYLRTQPRILWWYNHKQVFRGKANWAQINYIKKLQRLGVKKGISDIAILFLQRNGFLAFCVAEVKDPNGGVEEDEQVAYIKDVEARGGFGAFVRSLDDLIGLLERAGYWK